MLESPFNGESEKEIVIQSKSVSLENVFPLSPPSVHPHSLCVRGEVK